MTTATDDELDEKLARLGRRLETRRDEVRIHLAHDPDLLALAEACKARFDGKLRWLKVGEFEQGKRPTWW